MLGHLRQQLESLAAELRACEGAVPPRGRRFHEIRVQLNRDLSSLLARRLWIDAARLDGLREEVERLRGMAGDLALLLARVEALEAEVGPLEARAAEMRDPELAGWLRSRCGGWATALAHLGAECQRRADLLAEQLRLGLLEEQLRWHGEAVRWWLRAEAVLALVGQDVGAAELAAELAELKRRLLRDGATPGCADRMKELVTPLEERAREVKDPPPELQTLGAVLADLRGWSRQLRAGEAEVRRLEESHNFIAADWRNRRPVEVQALAAEAEALRERLLAQARELRHARLQELEEELSDLFAACGPQPGLEERLASLEARAFDRPQLFRDWLDAAAKAAEHFRAIATTRQGELEERLAGLAANLGHGLTALRAQPLSDAVRGQADVLEHEVRKLGKVNGAEELLRALRRCVELARGLEALSLQARQDVAELSGLRTELRERHLALQEAARQVEIEVAGLTPEIETLTRGAEARSLAQERELAYGLRARLEELEGNFIGRCRELLAALAASTAAAGEGLRRTGSETPRPVFPGLAEDADLQTAAATLLAGRRLAGELAAEVAGRVRELEGRRLALAEELSALDRDTLGPGERETAAQLGRDLVQGAWSVVEDPVERLERLAETVARCSLFLEQRHADERQARHGLEELRVRLAAFEEEGLRRHCPELAERVSGLIWGIPGRPRRWHDVQAQVTLARELLEKLEGHTRRLAAGEVDRLERELQARLRRSLAPSLRAEVGALLAELDACGHGALPPVLLRLKLRETHRRCS